MASDYFLPFGNIQTKSTLVWWDGQMI